MLPAARRILPPASSHFKNLASRLSAATFPRKPHALCFSALAFQQQVFPRKPHCLNFFYCLSHSLFLDSFLPPISPGDSHL